ncbi:hypothetical protein Tco_1175327 [Tanacetum coccineum]
MDNTNPFVPVSPNGLHARITQELNELHAISAMIDSRLENIDRVWITIPPTANFEQLFNDFMNPPDIFEMDDLESDDESINTPLVSPFLDSDDELGDGEVFNDLDEYENAGNFNRNRIINSIDGDELALPCMIGFRNFQEQSKHLSKRRGIWRWNSRSDDIQGFYDGNWDRRVSIGQTSNANLGLSILDPLMKLVTEHCTGKHNHNSSNEMASKMDIDSLTIEQYLMLTEGSQTSGMVKPKFRKKNIEEMTIDEYMEYEAEMKRKAWKNIGSYFPLNYDNKDVKLFNHAESRNLGYENHSRINIQYGLPPLLPYFELIQPHTQDRYEPLDDDTKLVSEDESDTSEQGMSDNIDNDKPLAPKPQHEELSP